MLYGLFALIIFVVDCIVVFNVLTGRGSAEYKILWTLLIFLLPVFGLILYFLFGRKPALA